MRTGLVLGKFAPLHKGHQLLINTAVKENDHVIVMIYDAPAVTNVPLPVRSSWIKRLYPSVQVIEAWEGPLEVGDTAEIKRMHEEYILKTLDGEPITNFYSSEFYGDHVSRSLGAHDRRVDPTRREFPISATVIREDVYGNRQYLDPIVYRDLITKAVFLGAPSTGKTSLARELARIHKTVWMPEYGREYWEQHQRERRLSPKQLVEIAEQHIQREDEICLKANRYFFIDTDATTTFMFSIYYHGKVHPRLTELASKTLERYDLFFLCEADIPYDNTWDRSGETNREMFQKQIKTDLLKRKIPFISLSGSLEKRVQNVNEVLRDFDKFKSLN